MIYNQIVTWTAFAILAMFSHDIFGFDSFEYQKFADVWAIGNCTVDLTDKIKFLREIAGMLEER